MPPPITIFWFRRDLRLDDNAGLYHALQSAHPVLPLFIFDRAILDDLTEKRDARVEFIHRAVTDLHQELKAWGSSLEILDGQPAEVWAALLKKYAVTAVYTNHDYEPYAIQRDAAIAQLLQAKNIPLHSYKDQVIFEKSEVVKDDGQPYTVFTPYKNKWLTKLQSRWIESAAQVESPEKTSFYLSSYPTRKHFPNLLKTKPLPLPTLKSIGFEPAGIPFPSPTVARGLIKNYGANRDTPGIEGTSRLGIHFRFGTISVREKARHAYSLSEIYLSELIWRDFYSQILYHFPRVVGHPFRAKYDRIPWRDSPADFERWCQGQTGYPIVDAGMRQLNTTGFMHNRVRMIVASFLTKHLLIDWRQGEAYFAQKLLDFDLASNNGGWQWAAGCGTDAAPYFRVFNPWEQTKKFDPQHTYIRTWVPEFDQPGYPQPMVEHTFARERAIATYKRALAE
ncbi:MAG: deoxyribodipyrimidine photo-lyase [Saprospiraceae bacterium]